MTMHILSLLCISFLCNTINDAACNKSSDALTHKICYRKGYETASSVKAAYDTTIDGFSHLSSHGYTFGARDCVNETDDTTPEIPTAILANHDCFSCCIATVTSNVESVEYTQWRLLYTINENIIPDFSDNLTTNSPSSPSYIYYATSAIDTTCSSSKCTGCNFINTPHICDYPLPSNLSDPFIVALWLDIPNERVTFYFGSDDVNGWLALGIGPMDNKGDAIILSDPYPSGSMSPYIGEWILNDHHNLPPNPAPTVTADSNQGLIGPVETFYVDTFFVNAKRGSFLNQDWTIYEQFTDETEFITLYAAWSTSNVWEVSDHGPSNRIPETDVLITPADPNTKWCNAVIDCAGTVNDCCIIVSSPSPTPAPTNNPTTPTNLPTTLSSAPTSPPSITTYFPTDNPTSFPTHSPTSDPTHVPTRIPTLTPTSTPTVRTLIPSFYPTHSTTHPSNNPTFLPTAGPTTSIPTTHPSDNPTTIPTYFPTLPSISPSQTPTMSPLTPPSLAPSIAPTDIPSIAPTISPTMSPSQAPIMSPTSAPLATAELLKLYVDKPSAKTDALVYVVLFGIPILLIIIAILFKFISKMKNKITYIDDQRYKWLFLYFVQIFDLYSDVVFAFQLYAYYSFVKYSEFDIDRQTVNEFYILFIIAIIFTILPFVANFVSSIRIVAIISSSPIISKYSKDYFKQNSILYSIGVILSGGSFYTLQLLNSNFLSLPQLSAGLSKLQITQFESHKIFLTTLLENIPQLMIQCYVIIKLDLVTTVVIMSLTSSVFNILLSILNTLMKRVSYKQQKEFSFKMCLVLSSNDITDPYLKAGYFKKLSKKMKEVQQETSSYSFDFEFCSFSKLEKAIYGVVVYDTNEKCGMKDMQLFVEDNIEKVVRETLECDRLYVRYVFKEQNAVELQETKTINATDVFTDTEALSVETILDELELSEYLDQFKEQGWDDCELWKELLDPDNDKYLQQIFGNKHGHKIKFLRFVKQLN